MDPAPGFMIEGTKVSQISNLLETIKQNNEFVSFVEMLQAYEQKVDKIDPAIQEAISTGQAAASMLSNFSDTDLQHISINEAADVFVIAKEAAIAAKLVDVKKNVKADLVFSQWALESGNFGSRLARENRNLGGLTQPNSNGEENKQPDGNCYYKVYNSVKEYGEDYIKSFLNYYPEVNGRRIEDPTEFATILKKNGYFGADLKQYIAGIMSYMGSWEKVYTTAMNEQKSSSSDNLKKIKGDK